MRRKPDESRVAIFEVLARHAFTRESFHAVSIADLLTRAGLTSLPLPYRTKASVYEALTGKPAPSTGRDRVRQAARRVFAEDGYFKATVRRVAEAGGGTGVTVLRLYPNKATLWRETMGREPPEGAKETGWGGARLVAAEETRAKVLETAKRQFTTQTYDDVSIRGVAKAAGVSTGAVMCYFPTKEALWRAAMSSPPPGDSLLTRRAHDLLEVLKAVVREDPGSLAAARQLILELESAA